MQVFEAQAHFSDLFAMIRKALGELIDIDIQLGSLLS